MPDRILRASIVTSDRVNSVDWGAEVFYRRLMSVVDDYGRYDGRVSILRAQLFALKLERVSESDVAKWISKCCEAGLVRQYTVDTKPYIELLRFNQRIRSETSKWPTPPPSSADNCPPVPATGGHPPPYSYAETYAKTKTVSGREAVEVVFPLLLNTEDFKSAWADWMQHRREKKKPVTPTSQKQAFRELEEMGLGRAIAAIRHSIGKGWTGIFEPGQSDHTAQRPVDEASQERRQAF